MKEELIEKIIQLHPACGVEDKVSWYVGGMRDTGDWYVDKLQSKSTKWLKWFYKKHNIPADEFTPSDEMKSFEVKTFNVDGKIYWIKEDEYNFMMEKRKEIERNILSKLIGL